MFTNAYFWYFIFAYFFSFLMKRVASRWNGANELARIAIYYISTICHIALIIFLIIGFWKMDHWWQPLVMYGCAQLTALIPIPDHLGAFAGLFLSPLFTVLMYINFFIS